MASIFWTVHLLSGAEDHIGLHDDTREVSVTAIAGDSYISPDASAHPPALDTMTSFDHWNGAIILHGTTRTFKLRLSDLGPDGNLYVGTVSPAGAPSTLSVIATTA